MVLAGTGPVGMRAAGFFGMEGCDVTITSRTKERAEAAAKVIEKRFGIKVAGAAGATDEERAEAVKDANIVYAAGAIGVQLLPKSGLGEQPQYRAAGRRECAAAARHRRHRGDRQGQGP